MGCFDFIYADNGNNIRGQKGYLYLTDAICQRTGLKSPMRFTSTDAYGIFDVRLTVATTPISLDIYAIYASMLVLDHAIDDKSTYPYTQPPTVTANHYLDILKDLRLHPDHYNHSTQEKLECLEEDLRLYSIDYFFQHMVKTDETINVPALSGQHAKTLTTDRYFNGSLPLVITRKKLPSTKTDGFYDIVKNWGFVSSDDPNQGFGPTKNEYTIWKPE